MGQEHWVRVAAVAEVPQGKVIGRNVMGRPVALYHLDDGEFCATAGICTHQYFELADGWLEDGVIECPLHAGQFDVRTGRALCAPATVDLETFKVRVEDDQLFVSLPEKGE